MAVPAHRSELGTSLSSRLRPPHFAHAVVDLLPLLLPAVLALDDRHLEQDHELAFRECLVARAGEDARRLVGRARNSRALVRLLLAHEAADRRDRAVLQSHDRVALVDVARCERELEYAKLR